MKKLTSTIYDVSLFRFFTHRDLLFVKEELPAVGSVRTRPPGAFHKIPVQSPPNKNTYSLLG
jgi:hypothetical protein